MKITVHEQHWQDRVEYTVKIGQSGRATYIVRDVKDLARTVKDHGNSCALLFERGDQPWPSKMHNGERMYFTQEPCIKKQDDIRRALGFLGIEVKLD